jgi:hypothetical protein
MTFLTINAHNRMLDATYHINLGTTYLKVSSRKLLLKFCFIVLSELRYPISLGYLHSVACVRSGDGVFYPSTQRHYPRLIM